MPGKIVCPREERSLARSLRFGIKAVPLSSRTVGSFHETHHCSTGFILPCLPFLTNRASHISVSRSDSLFPPSALSLSFSAFPLADSPSLSPTRPLRVVVSFLSFFPSLPLASPVLSTNLLPNGVLYGRSPSARLPEKRARSVSIVAASSRWRGCARFR